MKQFNLQNLRDKNIILVEGKKERDYILTINDCTYPLSHWRVI